MPAFLIHGKYLLIHRKIKLLLAPFHERQRQNIGVFLINIYVHVNK